MVNIQKIVLPMSRKVKNVLKDVTIRQGDKNANRYSPSSKTIYFNTNATKDIMEHEIGHAIEETLFDAEKVRSLKQKLTQGLTVKDIRKVKGDDGTGREQDIFVLKNAELIDIYQGRIYADSKEECVDAQGILMWIKWESSYRWHTDITWTTPESCRYVSQKCTSL